MNALGTIVTALMATGAAMLIVAAVVFVGLLGISLLARAL